MLDAYLFLLPDQLRLKERNAREEHGRSYTQAGSDFGTETCHFDHGGEHSIQKPIRRDETRQKRLHPMVSSGGRPATSIACWMTLPSAHGRVGADRNSKYKHIRVGAHP